MFLIFFVTKTLSDFDKPKEYINVAIQTVLKIPMTITRNIPIGINNVKP